MGGQGNNFLYTIKSAALPVGELGSWYRVLVDVIRDTVTTNCSLSDKGK